MKNTNERSTVYHTKSYYTLIKNNDQDVGGGNRYVQGVIMGIMESVCVHCVDDEFLRYIAKGTPRILVDRRSGDTVYCIHTTKELYETFTNIVNQKYPGVCEFDIYD